MDRFDIRTLLQPRDLNLHTYEEFFPAETLSLCPAVWPAGSVDSQSPHVKNEVSDCAYWAPDALPQPISGYTVRRIIDALNCSTSALPTAIRERDWQE